MIENLRKIGADELTGNGEDEAGLGELVEVMRGEEVGKREAGLGIGEWSDRSLHAIAREINPLEEVSNSSPPIPRVICST